MPELDLRRGLRDKIQAVQTQTDRQTDRRDSTRYRVRDVKQHYHWNKVTKYAAQLTTSRSSIALFGYCMLVCCAWCCLLQHSILVGIRVLRGPCRRLMIKYVPRVRMEDSGPGRMRMRSGWDDGAKRVHGVNV